jgi:hypothetical protein
VTVAGGSYSIAADFERLKSFGAVLERATGHLVAAVAASAWAVSHPVVLTAGTLDPAGAIELAGKAARLSICGLATAMQAQALATGLLAAAATYRAADELGGRMAPLARALGGSPPALGYGASEFARGLVTADPRRVLRAPATVLALDPALTAPVIDALSAGALREPLGIELLRPRQAAAPGVLAAVLADSLYRDGRPRLDRRPAEPSCDDAGAPRGLGDVIDGLAWRNNHAPGGGIDVRFIQTTRPGGPPSRSVIVDITGTRDWNVAKLDNPEVADFGTNLHAVGGRPTTYEKGVLAALRASGVRPDEPIMLVGHSQGGIVAAQLTAHLAAGGRLSTGAPGSYRITHLVTAGSPIGLVDVPPSVQALCLENKGDVVPELDTADNRRHSSQLTIGIDRGGTGLDARHDLDAAYLRGARDVDASGDPSIRAWLAGASPFLTGERITTTAYRVVRQ